MIYLRIMPVVNRRTTTSQTYLHQKSLISYYQCQHSD